MEMRLNIGYEQILKLVLQLSYKDKQRLTREINRELEQNSKNIANKEEDQIDNFQKLLLNGPTMSDDQYIDFLELRKDFNQWLKQ